MEKYSMLMVLGEGSFGRVLLVQHKNRCQKYALKEIRLPESVFDTEKSWNECILLAKMKHPNIVTYAESFKADGHLYIVMEYCDDGDLMQKIKLQKGKFFPEDTNVFLTQNGKVKLGDFGSAILLTSPMAYACSYVGTPYYVPPEIWENTPYNNKSDIWSLGCILYELCTLKHPFQANSWKHLILMYICKGYYSPLPSHYTYELHYLIKQMFKKNPKNRPSASTILARNCLTKHIRHFSSVEEERRYSRNKNSHSEAEAGTKSFCEMGLEKKGVDKTVSSEAVLQNPHRQQWEKGRSSTVINILENASLLSSSITSKEDTGGHVRKYDENIMRKQWTKEPPETLMNILHNAASDDLLRGPLNEETKTSDEPDGETAMEDSEILEHRSDEEDTDFEAEDDCDWISALETMTNMKSLTK
ncbi:serine/threonine-protein kinase Nek3 isoform X2 [Varanus komodoensis]|uniref:serine/threonine-protein kinase Nek3 isoform X2 n=1 Tax=Varanus komodoensis TaxID=61221 RepID=UPI001CF78297|nr:serine/threonine-protein kinase Nek3 isoform X2 [Varanus komodoensis]